MSNTETRVATELLIDTGRRPDEIYTLAWDCLESDPDGSPVLVYDNHKAYRLGRRLPIGGETAEVIRRQQERVRDRFPDTEPARLKLLPRPRTNLDCLGCEHFSTDVSYLPDLQAHLADRLRSRERLMSAFEADEWARTQAMPSQVEISRVRRLIDRVSSDLDQLTAEDRAQIEQAVTLVRRSRTVHLGMPRVGQPLPDVRPPRTHPS